jgi:putative N6-adenine-specific DNA methylase
MTKPDALEKRIKRNVTAREHRFFAVVSPGLENVCRNEISGLLGPDRPVTAVDGGIEFQGTVTDAYRANLSLRTASRIIMRFSEFTATDFRTLEKKVRDIPWELYLTRSHIPVIHATARKSRLNHTGAIDQRFRENIAWRLEASGLPAEVSGGPVHEQNIYVRVVHDRFELSLDSSGDLLYMRGLKTRGGRAPMRETLAAGLLALSGYDGKIPLVDPMCGSGSFALEAAMMARNIPPGWFRSFAFQYWPCFREGAFRHIRKLAEEGFRMENLPPVFASDTDEKVCASLIETVSEAGFSDMIQVRRADVADLEPPCSEKGLVMVNPPYGLRLGTEKASKVLIENLFRILERRFRGWRAGVVSPFDKATVNAPRSMSPHVFVHGGLRLFLFSGTPG